MFEIELGLALYRAGRTGFRERVKDELTVIISGGAAQHLAVDDDLDQLTRAGAPSFCGDHLRVAVIERLDIRSDAMGTDAAPLRGQPLEAHVDELTAVAERPHDRGGAFAEGLLTYHECATALLQASPDELAGRAR